MLETRFADETPLVKLAFNPAGDQLVIVSQSGNVKVFETRTWTQSAVLGKLKDLATGLAVTSTVFVPQMNGELWQAPLGSAPAIAAVATSTTPAANPTKPTDAPADTQPTAVAANSGELNKIAEQEGNDRWSDAQTIATPAEVTATIGTNESPADEDWYRFTAKAGETWSLEINAARQKSPLDSVIEVRDAKGEPIEQVRLQAMRDSYFTFRGKDSDTSDDFRVFAWQEMQLNEYLYSDGEVVRLWLYPRGPDSGFKVYPGEGKRWTFFGTSPLTHALAAPCYIVRPLAKDEAPIANGLPVFSIKYVNDDDPQRRWDADSHLLFKAPADGEYLVRVRDARGQGGSDYKYQLAVRPARPRYTASISGPDKPIPRGAGREFNVRVEREDGFDGPVEVHVEGLPPGVHATTPVVVEAGQVTGVGTIYADADALVSDQETTLTAFARADIHGQIIDQPLSGLKPIKISDRPKVQVVIEPVEGHDELTSIDPKMLEGADSKPIELPESGPVVTSPWTLHVKPGQTVAARLVVLRNGFDQRVEFGNDNSGRNLPFGVFVDNIGLNGLMVPEGASRRTFFVTASPVATPQRRLFFLRANNVDGGTTSWPIVIAVEP